MFNKLKIYAHDSKESYNFIIKYSTKKSFLFHDIIQILINWLMTREKKLNGIVSGSNQSLN